MIDNNNDGRYTISNVAKAVGISLAWVYIILKRILKEENIHNTGWMPHLLTKKGGYKFKPLSNNFRFP